MTNFDRLKNTKIGDWFEFVNGSNITLIPMLRLMYLNTNCDSCPCHDKCHIIKVYNPGDCSSMLSNWLTSEEGE